MTNSQPITFLNLINLSTLREIIELLYQLTYQKTF